MGALDLGSFPENDPREIGYGVAKVTLGFVPGLGGAAQELLDKVVGAPLQKRREAWFKALGEAFVELSEKVSTFDPDALAQDEAFVSTVARATQQSMATHSQIKRAALRNIVLNAALKVRLDEVLLGSFLDYVERFSEAHLKLLALLDAPMSDPAYAAAAQKVYMGSIHGVIVESHPDLAQPSELLDRLYGDLSREDLVNGSFKALMSASGVQNPQTTAIGKAFLDFIRAPDV